MVTDPEQTDPPKRPHRPDGSDQQQEWTPNHPLNGPVRPKWTPLLYTFLLLALVLGIFVVLTLVRAAAP